MRNPPSADISASYVFYSGACALSFLRLAHFNIRKKYLQYRMWGRTKKWRVSVTDEEMGMGGQEKNHSMLKESEFSS
jgi:hypothetical protein